MSISLPPTGFINSSRQAEGILGLNWLDFISCRWDIPDGTTILKMTFDVTGLGGQSTSIFFDSLSTLPIEISKPGEF
ncbi:MAG: hypothetical protein R2784_10585 [Saprospiraceae bacterium]